MSIGAKLRSRISNYLLGQSRPSLWYWAPIETLAAVICNIGLSYYFSADDPLYARGPFPWCLVLPMFIALRYGTFYGLLSVSLPLAFFKSVTAYDAWINLVCGQFVFVMIIGEFSRFWFYANAKLDERGRYLKYRIDQLSRVYFLLKLSHKQLENNLILKPITLRQIIEKIRRMIDSKDGEVSDEAYNALLMQTSQYCGFTSAAIFKAYHNGKITNKKLAGIGEDFELNFDDPLFQQERRLDKPRYWLINELPDKYQSSYLIVAPIQASSGKISAYYIVKDMSFTMLHDDTINILMIILLYFANSVEDYNKTPNVLRSYPSCPGIFARDLLNCIKLYEHLAVESYLVSIFVHKSKCSELLQLKLTEIHRSMDQGWWLEEGDYFIHLNLMPFTNSAEIAGYLDRMQKYLRDNFLLNMDGETLFFTHHKVRLSMPIDQVQEVTSAVRKHNHSGNAVANTAS